MARAWSQDRLAPLIQSNPSNAGNRSAIRRPKMATTRSLRRYSGTGPRLSIAGSNSPAGLASRPIRIVPDGRDRQDATKSAGSEGCPVMLATRRTANYFNRKGVSRFDSHGQGRISYRGSISSSRIKDTIEVSSCLGCGAEQVLEWGRVRVAGG